MPILNGFFRGAYDKEVTAHIDQKEYAGVATELYNFVGTKRGALSKRAPFKFRLGIEDDTYLIPYIYDQDQRFLLLFRNNAEIGKAEYRMLNYWNGALTFTTVGHQESVVQPTFTSDSQDNFECSQSKTVQNYQAYQRFNGVAPMNLSEALGYSIVMKFPHKFVLSKLEITNKQTWRQSTGSISGGGSSERPGTGIYIYHQNVIDFIVEGSNDGKDWYQIKESVTDNSTLIPTSTSAVSTTTYSELNAYEYLRIRVTRTTKQTYKDSEKCNFGNIKFSGIFMYEDSSIITPYTMQEIKELHYTNENQRMILFHKNHHPQEIKQNINPLEITGLQLDPSKEDFIGYPTFGCFYQERLGMGGFTINNRQFNLSKSNPKNTENFVFTLTESSNVPTAAMQFVIRRAKYPLKEVLSGRNMIYLQCIDGLATISSGGDEVPLTATQVSADLRNRTPFSDIPAIYQEETAFLVGSDYKTVYAMDFDFNVMRVRTLPINEHCLSYFESGIAQMIPMKGSLPYIVFRLNNGKMLIATSYRTTTGFAFNLYPVKIEGKVNSIATIMNNLTGFDTLFAVVQHSNGVYALESLESILEQYIKEKGEQYFIDNLMLDYQYNITAPQKDDIIFAYTGIVSDTNRHFFSYVGSKPELTNGEIKIIFAGEKEITCKDCRFDDNGMWADVSSEPPIGESVGYIIPQKTFEMDMYQGLPVVLFDGEDVVQKESESDGVITFARPVYKATTGLIYDAYAQFENVADVSVAGYEKIVPNIAASITYGTGIRLGTESATEKIGSSNYKFKEWKDKVLQDESLKNVILSDQPRKDKKIVIECNYPFPANITFITYDIKATGVK